MEDKLTMKKIIALLLTLIMVFSAVIAVSADETTGEEATVTPTAPVMRGIQSRINPENSNTSDVRFLATVHSDNGDAVGMEITATYTYNNAVYSVVYKKGADTTKNEVECPELESTAIYTSVNAAGATVTVGELAEGDETAIGILAAVISGVPNDSDISFDVKTYVKNGDVTTYSAVSNDKFVNGAEKQLTTVYTQDFNNSHIKNLYNGNMAWTLANGKLNILNTTWANGPFVQIVDRSTFANAPQQYVLEMTFDITKYNNIALMFNGRATTTADTGYKLKDGAAVVQFKIDGDSKNSISNLNDGTKRFYTRTGYNYNGTQTIAGSYGNPVYTIPEGATSAVIKLSLYVDCTPTNGCDINIFVNDSYISTRELRGDGYDGDAVFDATSESYVSLWAQESIFTVDDLKVSEVTGDVASQAFPSAEQMTTLYENDFDYGISEVETDSSLSGAALVFPKSIDYTNEKYSVTKANTPWESAGAYYWSTLIDKTTLNDALTKNTASTFVIETDIETGADIGNFAFILTNTSNSTATGKQNYLQRNALMVKLENNAGKLQVIQRYCDAAGVGQNSDQELVVLNDVASYNSSFKLTMMMSNIEGIGCVLTTYINGEFVCSVKYGTEYMTCSDTSLVLMQQSTTMSLDNLTLKVFKTPETN